MRVIVQEILSGDFVDWDLPVEDLSITFALSGPTQIRGKIGPEIPLPRRAVLEPWAQWLHIEESGTIRASGILQPATLDDHEFISIDAIGPSGYPHGIPYLGEFSLGSPIGVGIDPLDVVRDIWDHIQSYPEGNLGVVVDSTTSPIRIGTPKEEVSFETGAGEQVDFIAGPYTIDWWENTLCGTEINNLAKETPFDFRDRCEWNDTLTNVEHRIELGYPRVGGKRTDLRFAQDENILEIIPLHEPDAQYASQVVVSGSGEGRDSIRGYAGQRIGSRVRRVAVLNDKSISSITRANAVANDELRRRQGLTAVDTIVINSFHQNAEIGSFWPGDDIFIQGEVAWYDEPLGLWHRVISIDWTPDKDTASVKVARSDTFVYGSSE